VPQLTVYSIRQGDTCPPAKADVNGRVKIDAAWGYFETGETTPKTFEVTAGEHALVFKSAQNGSDCMWEPVEGQALVTVAPTGVTNFCQPYRCTTANEAAPRLSGTYTSTRIDTGEQFAATLTFRVNAPYCVAAEISSPGAIDHATGYLHMQTGPGEGHPGDWGAAGSPLSAGAFTGEFTAADGSRGIFQLGLGCNPGDGAAVTIIFYGYLIFADQSRVEINFVKQQPTIWGPGGIA
jgi:hypothetical protein